MVIRRSPVSCAGQYEPIEAKVVEEAYLKGIVYARRKLTGFSQSGLGASISPEDVTHIALLKVLDGVRPWDPDKTPDFFVHLAGCIKGEISNAYRSADNRLINRGVSANELEIEAEEPRSQDDIDELKKIVQAVLAYIKENRRDLLDLARFMYEQEIHKPQDIAKGLNISVEEVNTRKFALKRILKGNRFLINYIANHHQHLESMAIAILKQKVEKRATKLACHLGIPESEARSQRDELFLVLDSIRKGMV